MMHILRCGCLYFMFFTILYLLKNLNSGLILTIKPIFTIVLTLLQHSDKLCAEL